MSHGLRGNRITALEEANVLLNQIELLVGHKRKALADNTYSGGTSLEQLAEGVGKVNHGEAIDELMADHIKGFLSA